jgi:phospholipid/cholesterol/gamma-HCH transport system ATP-binding protein
MAMIEITNLCKSFGSLQVLRGVNLSVEKGESMTVIGGSGSGKSVLIKHIIGLLFPDKGQVKVDGQVLNELDEEGLNNVRKKFGMLFQGAALFDSLTVWENVGFGLQQHTKMSDQEIRATATEKLALVGLKDVEDKMPVDLSGGMKKRVGLARAIAMDPEIILYDEPTTGLDPITADAINDLIVDLRKKLGVTSVAITHDMHSAYKISDRIAMLYKGEIQEIGTPDEIKGTTNPIVKQFITGSAVGPITAD